MLVQTNVQFKVKIYYSPLVYLKVKMHRYFCRLIPIEATSQVFSTLQLRKVVDVHQVLVFPPPPVLCRTDENLSYKYFAIQTSHE